MVYEFKNLNEVPSQDKPTENTTVMAFEAGQPKQIPASEFGGKGLVVDLRGYTPDSDQYGEVVYTISDINYDPIYEKITSGGSAVLIINDVGYDCYIYGFTMLLGSTGLIIAAYENYYDHKHYEITFTNGSYHTTA